MHLMNYVLSLCGSKTKTSLVLQCAYVSVSRQSMCWGMIKGLNCEEEDREDMDAWGRVGSQCAVWIRTLSFGYNCPCNLLQGKFQLNFMCNPKPIELALGYWNLPLWKGDKDVYLDFLAPYWPMGICVMALKLMIMMYAEIQSQWWWYNIWYILLFALICIKMLSTLVALYMCTWIVLKWKG